MKLMGEIGEVRLKTLFNVKLWLGGWWGGI
jgi:hypothetical protein